MSVSIHDIRASPIVRAIGLLATGAFSALLLVGRPEWWVHLWSPVAAAWAAALGTIFAAVVALLLGTQANRRASRRDAERSSAAALSLFPAFLDAMAALSGIETYKRIYKEADVLGTNAPRYRETLLALPDLLPATHHIFLAELRRDVAQWVTLAGQAQARMRRKLLAWDDERHHWELAEDVFVEADSLAQALQPAALCLHDMIYGPEVAPPWSDRRSLGEQQRSGSA